MCAARDIVSSSTSHSRRGWLLVLSYAVFGISTFLGLPTSADEAPTKLPKDGWWVRYFVTMNGEGINDNVIIKRTYSLVGTTTENGEKCRSVEMKTVQMVNGKEQTDVIKFLVPERELLESEKPLEGLLRAWRRIDDGTVEEQKFNQPV